MKKVFGVDYYEGIPEGTSNDFDSLKDAKHFVENAKNGRYHKIHRTIFKYEERNCEPYRYVKRIWVNRKGKWFSTRKKLHKVILNLGI